MIEEASWWLDGGSSRSVLRLKRGLDVASYVQNDWQLVPLDGP